MQRPKPGHPGQGAGSITPDPPAAEGGKATPPSFKALQSAAFFNSDTADKKLAEASAYLQNLATTAREAQASDSLPPPPLSKLQVTVILVILVIAQTILKGKCMEYYDTRHDLPHYARAQKAYQLVLLILFSTATLLGVCHWCSVINPNPSTVFHL